MMILAAIFALLAEPLSSAGGLVNAQTWKISNLAAGAAVGTIEFRISNFSFRGWRPFLDPLPLDSHYLLFLIPLVVVIAVVYKTIKLDDLSALPKAALVLSIQIITFMALAAIALWLITEMM